MQYFYEPVGRVKIQNTNNEIYYPTISFPKILTCQGFELHAAGRNETSTNICYLYSFRALFVLQEAELDNKSFYILAGCLQLHCLLLNVL